MLKKQFISKIICTMLVSIMLLTSCGKGNTPAGSSSKKDDGSAGGNVKPVGAMGRFVQKDISPLENDESNPRQFSRSSDGKILLTTYNDKKLELRAYTYEGDKWTEHDNKAITALIKDKKAAYPKPHLDYQGNWWVTLYTEDKMLHLYKTTPDGTTSEISVPYIKENVSAGKELTPTKLQPNEDGKICLTLLKDMGGSAWVIIDGKTDKVTKTIESVNADYNPYLKGEQLYTADTTTKLMNIYDINSGKISKSFPTEQLGSDTFPQYVINDDGQLVYVDSDGIHQLVPDGTAPQTIVENGGFAYASPSVYSLELVDRNDGTFLLACTMDGKLKVYNYIIDKSLSTALDETLYVWALDDTNTVRAAASIFASQFPNCEVKLEFGKTRDDTAVNDADIIKNLNTRLSAGEAPDVLFLDGLSVTTMIEGGMLTALDGVITPADYYENIINCYSKDGKPYAYPAVFHIPAFLSSDSADTSKAATLESLAELHKDKKKILNNSYQNIFDTFYTAMSHLIYPDGKSMDENVMKDFLTQTKLMVDNQGITEEDPNGIIAISGNGGMGAVAKKINMSISNFSFGDLPYGAGILDSALANLGMFGAKSDIQIVPLPGNSFLPKYISSIPKDATNKEMAKNFIKVLMTDPATQLNISDGGFTVKKGILSPAIKDQCEKMSANGGKLSDFTFKSDPAAFDWDGVIKQLKSPSNTESYLYAATYEQAKNLYTNKSDITKAVSEIKNKTKLYFAERQ